MGSLNKVMLIGRLGRDPEERTTANGKCVSSFSLATDTYRGANTEKITEWHRVVVFGKIAEQCNRYLHKGRLVCVEGHLQTKVWEKSPGDKKYFTDVVASRVTFLDSNSQSESHEGPEPEAVAQEEQAIPF
ncbi:MAG: single-stranded DNA-binding protein [Acidobacteria bacterium]|nr:single-stranded DNA-binding protein [Acidobacteriota bacterium]